MDILKDLIRHRLFTDQTDDKAQIFRKYVSAIRSEMNLKISLKEQEMVYQNIVSALKKSIKGIQRTSLSDNSRTLYDKISTLNMKTYPRSELYNFIHREFNLRSNLEELLRQNDISDPLSISSFLLRQRNFNAKQETQMIQNTRYRTTSPNNNNDTLFSGFTNITDPRDENFINNLKKYLIGGFVDFELFSPPKKQQQKQQVVLPVITVT